MRKLIALLLLAASAQAADVAFLAAPPMDWRSIQAINPQMGVLRTIPQARLMLAKSEKNKQSQLVTLRKRPWASRAFPKTGRKIANRRKA